MLKRYLLLMAVLALLVTFLVIPASAKTVDGKTVIDYNDYVTNIDVDGDNDLVTVSLPPYLYGYQTDDSLGKSFTQGVPLGKLVSNNHQAVTAGLYFPGAGVTSTFLDLSNIPNGSTFSTTGKVWLESYTLGSGYFEGTVYSVVYYYDSNFKLLSNDRSAVYAIGDTNGSYVYELDWNFIVDKPVDSAYCVVAFRFRINGFYQGASADNVFWFDFDTPKLKMSISSMYRLQEQSGKTNKLLDEIVNGDVTPETPNGAGSVGDLDDVEGSLKDDTSAGRDEAEQVFNDSWGLIVAHMSAFLFLSNVIELMFGVGWLRGIIVVSLSLGIFGFIVNIAMTIGNKLHNGKAGKTGKTGKGG